MIPYNRDAYAYFRYTGSFAKVILNPMDMLEIPIPYNDLAHLLKLQNYL